MLVFQSWKLLSGVGLILGQHLALGRDERLLGRILGCLCRVQLAAQVIVCSEILLVLLLLCLRYWPIPGEASCACAPRA